MPVPRLLLTVPVLAAVLLTGCKVTSSGDEAGGPAVAVDPAAAQEVSSYFSIYAYGPTKLKFDVPGEKALLLLDFPNQSKTISATGHLYLFPETTSDRMIQAWWNNQYSDAIFPEAAEPVESIALGSRLEIVSAEMTGQERPRPDQLYDTYAVTYRVSDIQTERFTLEGFTAETTVHVMMEGKRP